MGAVFVIGAVLLICMVSATPEQIRHARANPPAGLRIASRAAVGVLVVIFAQLLV